MSKLFVSLSLFLLSTTTSAQQCTNTRLNHEVDHGCTTTNPICVSNHGFALGWWAPGEKCVPCVNSGPFSTHVGCPDERPKCVLDDGRTVTNFLTAGTQCVGDEQQQQQPVGDLGVRFNKITFIDNNNNEPSDWQPLGPDDYPMSGSTAATLMDETNAASVMVAGDYELHGKISMPYINALGGLPSYPEDDPEAPYWVELEHVTDVQLHRRENGNPSTFMTLPDLWNSFDIHEVAEAVHDEYPGSLQVDLIISLWQQGVELDHSVLPFRCRNDFLRSIVGPADLNTWAIRTVSPLNFNAKWTAGRPRPEEVAWMIATGELTSSEHGVPESLVTKIDAMNLQSSTEFTAYTEGAPPHPSWPAMHSAASSASFWLSIIYKLTPEQLCQARLVDYAVSYARTVAGVHYQTDNIMGLNLGQEIMAEQLALHLTDLYNANRRDVQAKIDASRFDWNDFDPVTCRVN